MPRGEVVRPLLARPVSRSGSVTKLFLLGARVTNLHQAVVGEPAAGVVVHVGSFEEPPGQRVSLSQPRLHLAAYADMSLELRKQLMAAASLPSR